MQIQRTQQNTKCFKSNVSGTIKNTQCLAFNRTIILNALAEEAVRRGLIKAENIVKRRFLTKAQSMLSIVLYDKKGPLYDSMKTLTGELTEKNTIHWMHK